MAHVPLLTAEQAPLLTRDLFASGDPGALVASLAHVPEALQVTLPFVSQVLGPSALDARTKEIAILRTSVVQDCRFCVQTHTCVALDSGLSRSEVEALRAPAVPDGVFPPPEAALAAWAEEVARGPGPVDPGAIEALRAHFSDSEVVELTLLVATTLMLTRYCTALDLPTGPKRLERLAAEGWL